MDIYGKDIDYRMSEEEAEARRMERLEARMADEERRYWDAYEERGGHSAALRFMHTGR